MSMKNLVTGMATGMVEGTATGMVEGMGMVVMVIGTAMVVAVVKR